MKNIAKQIVDERLNQYEVVRNSDYGCLVEGIIRRKDDRHIPCKFDIFNDIQDRVYIRFLDYFTSQPITFVWFSKYKSFREIEDSTILFSALLKGFLTLK